MIGITETRMEVLPIEAIMAITSEAEIVSEEISI